MFRATKPTKIGGLLLNLPLLSKILPYYDFTHRWIAMLQRIWSKSSNLVKNNQRILIDVILKQNKQKVHIKSFYQLMKEGTYYKRIETGETDLHNLDFVKMFELLVTTSVPDDLSYLKQVVKATPIQNNLVIAKNEWIVTSENSKIFVSIMQSNPWLNLSTINAKIHQEWFKKQEDINMFNWIQKRWNLPSFELVLKHNEMVFPNLSLYKSILQTVKLDFYKLSTNLALVDLFRKSKVKPNDMLSFEMIEFDCKSCKKNNKYNVFEWIKYLVDNFKSTQKLVINYQSEYESKCNEALKELSWTQSLSLWMVQNKTQQDLANDKVIDYYFLAHWRNFHINMKFSKTQ